MTAQLLAALIVVESGGNDMARGAHGELGALQIRRTVVADVNRIHGTRYRHRDMTNRETAVQVCVLYVEHYAPGQPAEIQARVWNGGPRGAGKISTVNYWHRVRREIK